MRILRNRKFQVIVLIVIVTGYGFSAHRRQSRSGNDFPIYRQAAATLIQGESPYDIDAGLNGYVYLPFLAIAISPLTVVPESVAIWLWYLFNIAFTVFAFLLTRSLIRSLVGERYATGAVWISLLVHARFFLDNYDMGQVNVLLLVMALWGVKIAVVDGRDGKVGWPLGIALLIKPHAAILLVPFIIRRRWKAPLFAAAAAVIGTVVLPTLVVGPAMTKQLHAEWYQQVVAPSLEGTLQGSAVFDQSPQSALRRLVIDAPAFDDVRVNWWSVSESAYRVLTRALQLALGLGLMLVWLRRPGRSRELLILDVAMAFGGMLVLFGYALRAHFVALLLPGAILAGVWRARPEVLPHRRTALALMIVAGVMIVFTVPGLVGRTIAQWALAYSAVTVGTLLELALLAAIRLNWAASEQRSAFTRAEHADERS
jgi:hypothetical protein